MKKSKSSGTALKRVGTALIVVGVATGYVLRFVPEGELSGIAVVLGLVGIVLTVGGAFVSFRGKQQATQARAEIVVNDGKPDVLYLRPFKTDASIPGRSFAALTTSGLVSGLSTEEEQLEEVLKPFGDLIAIAHPGKSVPNPGAVKLRASDDEWQALVVEQMRAARLVIIRAGDGPGVLWEVDHARQVLEPKKLLLLVLSIKKKEYEQFRLKADAFLGVSLPDWNGLKGPYAQNGFLRFRDDWTPEYLPLYAPLIRRSNRFFQSPFSYALRPVFEDFGVEWREPPVSVTLMVCFGVLGLLGLLMVVGLLSNL